MKERGIVRMKVSDERKKTGIPVLGRRFFDERGTPERQRSLQRHGCPLLPLGDLVFYRDPERGVDVTAIWCGDPPAGRSALDMRKQGILDEHSLFIEWHGGK